MARLLWKRIECNSPNGPDIDSAGYGGLDSISAYEVEYKVAKAL